MELFLPYRSDHRFKRIQGFDLGCLDGLLRSLNWRGALEKVEFWASICLRWFHWLMLFYYFCGWQTGYHRTLQAIPLCRSHHKIVKHKISKSPLINRVPSGGTLFMRGVFEILCCWKIWWLLRKGIVYKTWWYPISEGCFPNAVLFIW